MKLRKILAVTAVAATMTAAFAVNAMAETPNKFTNFTYKDGVITVTADSQHETPNAPYTMLVVRVDETGLADTVIADSDIKQIDQADAPFTTINVGDLAAVSNCAECTANKAEKCSHTRTYEIRLGGDGTVKWGTLVVGGEEAKLIKVGDVNGNDEVNGLDASDLAMYVAGVSAISDEYYDAADVNDNGEVNGLDASDLAMYIAGVSDLCCEYTKDKTNHATPPTIE